MSSRRGVLASLFVAIAIIGASAQTDSTDARLRSFASLHAGALFTNGGSPYPSFTLMSGVAVDRVSLAVGAGYDVYYNWKTLPVFVGIGWEAVRFQNTALYIQVNGGYAKAWQGLESESRDGGHFIHPQIGYRLRQGRVEIHVSGGYKFQRLEYQQRVLVWGGWGGPDRLRFVRDMERVSFQVGVGYRSR